MVIGGVVLVLGTAVLVWLLVTGPSRMAGALPAGSQTLPVPDGFRATFTALQDDRLLLLGTDTQDKQMVVIADPRKPEAASVLILEPQ